MPLGLRPPRHNKNTTDNDDIKKRQKTHNQGRNGENNYRGMIEIAFLDEHDEVAITQWGGREFQIGNCILLQPA